MCVVLDGHINWNESNRFNIQVRSVNTNYGNVINYVIFDKHNKPITTEIFDTMEDAKEYIRSLPRQIEIINQ